MESAQQKSLLQVDNKELVVSGLFPRVARLRAEYHECVLNPQEFLSRLKEADVRADVFTFLQPVSEPTPKHDHPLQWDKVAVLTIDTYEKWWKQQINDKTRNMIRKAGKKGVTVQLVPFSDDLAKSIHAIYNECPLIQGKPSKHYGKDFETLKKAHATFLDRSVFIGAFHQGVLIGFIKLILHDGGESASLMQIISMVAHRDKSPSNALLGKAVELCAERRIRYLQYGIWSRRSLGEFKKHHGFALVKIPRYFVPLNSRGRVALSLRMHRSPLEVLPGTWVDALVNLRSKWYFHKYKSQLRSLGL